MRKEKMNYGNLVYLDPVIYTDAYVFIPKLFGWEKESVSAEIIVGDYRIRCNWGTKLLFNRSKGIVERMVGESCDKVVTLPMKGKIESLNASVAAGILLYAMMDAK